mmetsp:Transcript_5476/g.16226  ORF Transcript_5476/g.16226 Transcript_5476/m.16226 type:complete len:84 (+) Transcript_5476:434-685(+)
MYAVRALKELLADEADMMQQVCDNVLRDLARQLGARSLGEELVCQTRGLGGAALRPREPGQPMVSLAFAAWVRHGQHQMGHAA